MFLERERRLAWRDVPLLSWAAEGASSALHTPFVGEEDGLFEDSGKFGPRVNTAKRKLKNGETVLACWISTLSAVVVETLGYAGFDIAIFDAEHFPYDAYMMENLIRTAEVVGLTPIVK